MTVFPHHARKVDDVLIPCTIIPATVMKDTLVSTVKEVGINEKT